MRRNDLLKLYDWEERQDPQTGKTKRESVYVGGYYALPGCDLPALRRRALLWCCLSLAGVIAAGFVPALSTRTSWVMLPFLAVLLALCFCFASLFALRKTSERLNEIQKQDGVERLRVWSMVLMIASCLWAAGEGVFIGINWAYIRFAGDGLFFLGAALSVLGAVLLWLSVRKLKAEEVEPPKRAKSGAWS